MVESQPDPRGIETFLQNNAERIRDGETRDQTLGLRKKVDVEKSIKEFPGTLPPAINIDTRPLCSGSDVLVTRVLDTKTFEISISTGRRGDNGSIERSSRTAKPEEWIELGGLALQALSEHAIGNNGTSSD